MTGEESLPASLICAAIIIVLRNRFKYIDDEKNPASPPHPPQKPLSRIQISIFFFRSGLSGRREGGEEDLVVRVERREGFLKTVNFVSRVDN